MTCRFGDMARTTQPKWSSLHRLFLLIPLILSIQVSFIVYGVSVKDFGSNGLRLGMIVSPGNPDLLESVRGVGQYSSISGLTDSIMATMFEDQEFLDRYINANRKKLAELYDYVVTFLDAQILYARGSNAAFFVWCDLLTPYLKIWSKYSFTR